MKDKKKLLIIIGVILACIVFGALIFLLAPKNKEAGTTTTTTTTTESLPEGTYDMYIKINPEIRLVFEAEVAKCPQAIGVECPAYITKVIDYELVNDDAKNIYKDVDFKNKTVEDVLVLIVDKAKENNIDVSKMEVKSSFDKSEDLNIKSYIKEHSTYKVDMVVEYTYEENQNNNTEVTTTVQEPTGGDTTTTSTTSTTKKTTKEYSETNTTTSSHQGYINLNDNVKYVDGYICGGYVYVNPTCVGKTIGELATMYPNHDQFDDFVDLNQKLTLNDNYYDGYMYFSECKLEPPQAVINKVNNSRGYKAEKRTGKDRVLTINLIIFENESYNKYRTKNALANAGLVMEGGCGGGDGTTNWNTLDESSCKKWNLLCDRW